MSDNPLITPPRTIEVPLYSAEVEQEIQRLDAEIEAALANEAGTKRNGASPVTKLAKARDAYVEKQREAATRMVLQGINGRRRNDLLDACPPRKDNAGDKAVGYDRNTFPPKLIHACLIEPVVTDEQFAEWVETATAARFDAVFDAAEDVSAKDVDLPKSSAELALTLLRRRASEPLPGLV